MCGHSKGYYIEDRLFSLPELKILMDAVQSSVFITPQKTKELNEKLVQLTSIEQGKKLEQSRVHFNIRKHTNESIFYNVDALEEAIQNHHRVTFLYFDLNEYGSKVYRRGKSRYHTEPLTLIFHEDNYYLIGYNADQDALYTYRVDRMDDVIVEAATISHRAQVKSGEIPARTGQMFKMFSGPTEKVTLSFPDALIGNIYDKFGESVSITRVGPDTCTATVTIQVSPVFWGWIFQFAGDMRILSPSRLAGEYRTRAEKVLRY